MPKKTANKQTKVFILIASLIVLVLSALFVKNSMTDVDTSNSGTEPTQVVQPVVAPPEVPEGWVQYVNEEYGYSFWYPKEVDYGSFTREGYVGELERNDPNELHEIYFGAGPDIMFGISVIDGDLDTSKEFLATQLDNYNISDIDSKVIDLAGYEAWIWGFESQSIGINKIDYESIYIFLENKGMTYFIHIGGFEKNSLFSYENFSKEIISTFRLQ